MPRPVGERVASGNSWRLSPLEKDFESHDDAVRDLTNPLSAAVSFKLMNSITRILQKKRPSKKDRIEATILSFLHGVVEYEVSIGTKPQPDVQYNLKEMYDNLPVHSIVRRIAQNLVLATIGQASTAARMMEIQRLINPMVKSSWSSS